MHVSTCKSYLVALHFEFSVHHILVPFFYMVVTCELWCPLSLSLFSFVHLKSLGNSNFYKMYIWCLWFNGSVTISWILTYMRWICSYLHVSFQSHVPCSFNVKLDAHHVLGYSIYQKQYGCISFNLSYSPWLVYAHNVFLNSTLSVILMIHVSYQ